MLSPKNRKHDLISITDLTTNELSSLLRLASRLKRRRDSYRQALAGKTLVMIFEKPSLRTRLSFEIAMTQLGGHAVHLGPADIGLGSRESIADIARVTSRMADVIMARTFKHEAVSELARYSDAPVINGLTDLEHPCQTLADLLTILEEKGKFSGLRVAYVGDCENNVTHSLALACALLHMTFIAAGPPGYQMNPTILRRARELSKLRARRTRQVTDPQLAVRGADVVVTDTWVSMGHEKERRRRMKIFPPYRVTSQLMRQADPQAIFLHCLPTHRGEEVATEVIDVAQSRVFAEAENRLHAQKALLLFFTKAKLHS